MTEQFTFTWPMHQIDEQDHYVFLSDAHIYMTGEFDNWTKSILLKPNYKEQVYESVLPIQKFNDQGKFVFKFYFKDTDTWKCNPLYPIDTDQNGNQNNYITGFHMIKQAEELESTKREKHRYSESEEINEEIINELEVNSPPLNNEINQTSTNENTDLLKESVNESGEEKVEEQDNDTKRIVDVTLFPTENKTVEEAIAENREHIPILIHSTNVENEFVINEPIESCVTKDNPIEEKEKSVDKNNVEKQTEHIVDNENKGGQPVSGIDTTNSKDISDIDDIPTENRRKFKIKRKIKKNKRTGERIIVSQEIFELDQDDNVIATYKSMEEVENGTVSNEPEEPRERLYEIENVNDADTVDRSSNIITPNYNLKENNVENEEVQENPLIFKDDEKQKEVELSDSSIKEGTPEEEAEIPVVLKNERADNIEENMVENNNETTKESESNGEATNSRDNGTKNLSIVDEPVVKEQVLQAPKTEVHEGDGTSDKDNQVNQEKNLPEESCTTENKESSTYVKVVDNKESPLKQVAHEVKKVAETSPKKKLSTNKTVSTGTSSNPTSNVPDKPKKSGIFRKLKKKFF